MNTLFDVVETAAGVVNELVSVYKGSVEEPFGYVVCGLENLNSGAARLYTIFGAGISDVPWVCLGSGSSYARTLVDLVLAPGTMRTGEAVKTIPTIFTMVSNVQTTVGDGIDICIALDDHSVGAIVHEREVSLDRLRLAFLDAMGVRPSEKRRR
jgi:20S proteasome alpha/beta subunit